MNLNGTDYYYLYNAQGDVVALYDSTGTVVTEYVYDSWGKLLSTTGSAASTIGTLNPFRYRGYFYDTDLGFYLLETRYYDPETGRFINADGVVDNRGSQTTNLYTYCANNPINSKDKGGNLWATALAGGIIGAASGALSGYLKYKKSNGKLSKWTIVKSAAIGAASGALTGALGIGWAKYVRNIKYAKAAVAIGKSIISGAMGYVASRANRVHITTSKKYNGKNPYSSGSKYVSGKVVRAGPIIIDSRRTQSDIKQDKNALFTGIVAGVTTSTLELPAGRLEYSTNPETLVDLISAAALGSNGTGLGDSINMILGEKIELYPGES